MNKNDWEIPLPEKRAADATTRARYEGWCRECGDGFSVGAVIFKWGEAWVCAKCNKGHIARLDKKPEKIVVEKIVEKIVKVPVDWVAEMFKAVPVEHRSRVHRALAMAFHPDHGGNEQMMKKINAIFDGLGKR